jgi:ABC-type bacteriocin/lantibiotic exporter with double-glycine peptidase domain
MAVIVVGSAIFVWIRGSIFNTMSEKIAQNLRYDFFYFTINKDVAFFDDIKTGEILSRLSSDVAVI